MEWGCRAQCSAPCACKGREQGRTQSQNTRAAKGKQGQGKSSGCPVPCSVHCAGEGGHKKEAREGTGANEEGAAQRVMYRASSASFLSRRMVGVTCGLRMQVRNQANGATEAKLGKQRARQASKETRTV